MAEDKLFSSFCESGIQKQLSWMVLSQEFMRLPQDRSQEGYSHLKTHPGLEDLYPRYSLTRSWQAASVSPYVDLSRGCLSLLTTCQLALHRAGEQERAVPLVALSQKSLTVASTIFFGRSKLLSPSTLRKGRIELHYLKSVNVF